MGNAIPRRPVVLVVEDEFFLRINAVLTIEDAGFDVLEAASADQAIEILEDRPDVHVILLTYKSPGPWTASNSLTRCADDGRRSKSSRLPGTSTCGQTICLKAGAFYRSRTVRRKSSGPFVSWSETSRPANC